MSDRPAASVGSGGGSEGEPSAVTRGGAEGQAGPYRFDVVTLFEPLIRPYLQGSMLGRAAGKGIIDVAYTNPRDFTHDVHKSVDDGPYGGGAGMVMTAEPLFQAISHVREGRSPTRVVLLSPAGKPFSQAMAKSYAKLDGLCLVCGRYEGVDSRIADYVVDEEVSVGDYVLTGGELGAMIIIDAVSRMLTGVLGNAAGAQEESFTDAALLEHPQYTRPRQWRGHAIPEVLLSGNHAKINAWKRERRVARTQARRPDLYARFMREEGDRAKGKK